MVTASGRTSRVALVVVALALLAGTPAVLVAAHVRNPWALGGATALAAVVVALGAVWQQRYIGLLQRRDEQAFKTEDGCLVLADGRLPRVGDITDSVLLGVHKAAPAAIPGGRGSGLSAGEHVPAYVPRDSAAQARQCVLWLDDLEGYLGTGGLTAAQLARLLTVHDGHRVVIATIRAAEQARLTANDPSGDDTARQVLRDARQVIEQAHPIRVSRMFSGPELQRARARDWDPRVAEALAHSGTYGIAEYLAAGPALLREWEDARGSSTGPNARAAALVAAAIDIRRAGHTSPIPRALLGQVHELYLDDPEHARTPRESLADAWRWATQTRHATTSLLQPAADDRVVVFDYLVDTIQRRTPPGDDISEPLVRAAIDTGDPADADSLAATAYQQGRYALAERAYRKAWQEKTSDPGLGAEHPDTLTSRNDRALALYAMGRLEEAEAEHRAVLEIFTRVLGAEHPDTLTSRDNRALVLHDMGRLEEAEAEHRAVLEIRTRVLGAEHPDTLTSRNERAGNLRGLGRLDEAEAEHRAVLEIRTRVLGAEHPDTLTSRDNLAAVLRGLGRLEEAEAEHRAVLQVCTRVLGADRDNRALVLHGLGRLEEAEAEHRAVLEVCTRVLGPEHRDTLSSRDNLGTVLRDLGRLEEAEAEHRAVLGIFTRVLGAEHPDTLRDLGRLEET